MVIRGNTRGNGRQLAQYLLTEGGNDQINILEVDGRMRATDAYLHQTLYGMSLSAELTKSQKGLYHAQINPAYSEDRRMTNKDWFRAADILAHELGLSEQRRVIVLHTKKNRTHAHVVFERYDHETGKVISDSFSRLAQDRARKEMERVFEHAPTPHRNMHRPELIDTLTGLWQQTERGKDFIKAVHESGYLLAEGVPRHPFMVVDENGRSFDLVRQLKGVRIKEVRQRLRDETLIPEKQAIEIMRQRQEGSDASTTQQPIPDQMPDKAKRFVQFWETGAELTQEDAETQSAKRQRMAAAAFLATSTELTEETRNIGLEQETVVETSAIDAEHTTQQAEADEATREKYRATLRAFMQSEDELVIDTKPETDKQRQQERAGQFFGNQDALTADRVDRDQEPKHSAPSLSHDEAKDATFDDERMRKLILEQKEIRERTRQRSKRRSH